MEVKILLQGNETQYQAEEALVKAITSKYDTSKKPHPDKVVDEITLKLSHEYNKMLVSMMSDIFEIIKYPEEMGKSLESLKKRKPVITKEMRDHFERRTKYHIDRVISNMMSIVDQTGLDREEAEERANAHDKSKYSKEEKTLYIWLTEFYRRNKTNGEKWDYPPEIKNEVKKASQHHLSVNAHHPESHDDINNMSDLDILEMVCDWQAMSDEYKEGSCRGWAERNIGKKWKFNKDREKLIYKYISLLEGRSTCSDI